MPEENLKISANVSFLFSSLKVELEEVVTNRRGTTLCKVNRFGERFAIKTAAHNSPDKADLVLRHESSILKELSPEFSSYVADGVGEDFDWILLRWVEGETLSDRAKKLRAKGFSLLKTRTEFLRILLATAKKLARLNELGYVHADFQGVHCVVPEHGEVQLLDFGHVLGRNQEDSDYRGGMVHFNAPEVCQALLDHKCVFFDEKCQVHSFSSVAFFLYTGEVAYKYDQGKTEYLDILKAIASGNSKTFSEVEAPPFPELENLINACLSTDPELRPATMHVVVAQLEECLMIS